MKEADAMRKSRGVPGEQACVLCFEESCVGCEILTGVESYDPIDDDTDNEEEEEP